MLRDLVISLSLANLFFVDIWKLFLIRHSSAYPYYHWKLNPAPLLLATMLDVLLLSALLFIIITVARFVGKGSILRIGRLAFASVSVLVVVNLILIAVRNPPLAPFLIALKVKPQLLWAWQGVSTIYTWLSIFVLLIGCGMLTLMIHSLIFHRQRLIKLCLAILLITSPFALVTFTQAAVQWLRYRSGEQFREKNAPTFTQENRPHRILWLVFDEMDFHLSFVERPKTLELPELDRLRNESIFASNAFPPGGDTVLSLPALITGRLVAWGNRSDPNELVLTFGKDQSGLWSIQPNIFSRARAMGVNSGFTGWYHPYCRIIGNNLTKCSWEAASMLFLVDTDVADLISYSGQVSLPESMFRVGKTVFLPSVLRSFRSVEKQQGHWRSYFFQEFSNIHKNALAMATDRNLTLIVVHYPIPHPPGIYDRYRQDFSYNSESGYLDNLALADRVLRDLRQQMIEAGVWEDTCVLLTSDHRLRVDRVWSNHPLWKPSSTKEDPLVSHNIQDERVPFILKLPRETRGLAYEPAFNTVLSQDLLLELLSGKVSKKEEIVGWLDRHRSIAESPYKEGPK